MLSLWKSLIFKSGPDVVGATRGNRLLLIGTRRSSCEDDLAFVLAIDSLLFIIKTGCNGKIWLDLNEAKEKWF